MKKTISLLLSFVMIFSIFTAFDAIPASAKTKNLLKNPGAETGDLRGWKDSSSENCWMIGHSGDINGWEHPAARKGKYYFMTGWPSESGKKRYLYQDVKVTSYRGKTLKFDGYLGGYGHDDKGGIKLEYRTKKGKVLSSKSSKFYAVAWGDWSKHVSVSLKVPSKAYTARVYLIGALYEGSEADAYFDDLSLTVVKSKSKFTAPKPTKLAKIKHTGDGYATIYFKKIKGVKGYQAQWSESKKKIAKGQKVFLDKNLGYFYGQIGKTYYFRVRTYKLKGKKKVYSKWSKVYKVTPKS